MKPNGRVLRSQEYAGLTSPSASDLPLRLPASGIVAFLLLACAALPAQEVSRPRILGVPHVAFRVHDIEASRHFYKDFLGYSEPFSIKAADGKLIMTFVKINDRQYIELSPETNPDQPRFMHLALETDNAEALRQYLKSKGYKVSDKPASKGRIGNTATGIDDPDGDHIDVTQYEPGSSTIKDVGKDMSDARISTRLLHVGFYVSKPETARFYIDTLGFREFWRGSADGKRASYSNVRVPEGCDYVEFILGPVPTPERRGTVYHIALEVPDMDAALAKLNASPARKDYTRKIEVHTGRNHKRQANLFDPDGTRVELMEDHTVDGLPSPMAALPMFAK
ncbi:MAG TPA: VOC family protein [Bryobacteraceae bacterium]|nr:VOC family protein [Bryobacteraceae bacterium]